MEKLEAAIEADFIFRRQIRWKPEESRKQSDRIKLQRKKLSGI